MAPGKLAQSDNFVAIFQVAKNPLRFAMLTLFVLKNVTMLFCQGTTIWTKLHENPPPPPTPPLCPSPNNVGFRSLRAKTLCMCIVRYWRGEGGGLSRTCLKPCFHACGRKTQGYFFTEKESAWQISADSEQFGKSL